MKPLPLLHPIVLQNVLVRCEMECGYKLAQNRFKHKRVVLLVVLRDHLWIQIHHRMLVEQP